MDSTVTAKGQATIPKAIRDHLGLRPGDRVRFFQHPDGTVVLLPRRPISMLHGIVRSKRQPVSIEAMDEAIASGAAQLRQRRRR